MFQNTENVWAPKINVKKLSQQRNIQGNIYLSMFNWMFQLIPNLTWTSLRLCLHILWITYQTLFSMTLHSSLHPHSVVHSCIPLNGIPSETLRNVYKSRINKQTHNKSQSPPWWSLNYPSNRWHLCMHKSSIPSWMKLNILSGAEKWCQTTWKWITLSALTEIIFTSHIRTKLLAKGKQRNQFII